MGLRNLQEKLEKSFYWWKKNIKDHSNTEFSQLCYYQMKWRNNKDFQTLAQNRRNIDSLGKLQDWTKHKWILLILSNLLIRSNTNSQTTILKFFLRPIRIPNLTNCWVFSCWNKKGFVYFFLYTKCE